MKSTALSIVEHDVLPKPVRPEGWTFEQADKDIDRLVYKWRRLTGDILTQCFLVYEELDAGPGRKPFSPNGENRPTWTEWLKSKSIGKNTLTRHFIALGWLEGEGRQPVALPAGKYQVIYADPPWAYDSPQSTKPVSDHYPTLELDQLCELPIAGLAADNCVLYLWATTARLDWAFPVMTAWGFEYKTSMVWDKIAHNLGFYCAANHELVLIGGRGSSCPEDTKLANSIDSVQSIQRDKIHSHKPPEFREIIERLYPDKRRIELFARERHPGWDAWGNEL